MMKVWKCLWFMVSFLLLCIQTVYANEIRMDYDALITDAYVSRDQNLFLMGIKEYPSSSESIGCELWNRREQNDAVREERMFYPYISCYNLNGELLYEHKLHQNERTVWSFCLVNELPRGELLIECQGFQNTSENNEYYLLNRDGELQKLGWREKEFLNDYFIHVIGNLLVASSKEGNGDFYLFSYQEDGAQLVWHTHIEELETMGATCPIQTENGIVFCGIGPVGELSMKITPESFIFMLDWEGNLIWKYCSDRTVSQYISICAEENEIYAVNRHHSETWVDVLDAETGELLRKDKYDRALLDIADWNKIADSFVFLENNDGETKFTHLFPDKNEISYDVHQEFILRVVRYQPRILKIGMHTYAILYTENHNKSCNQLVCNWFED